MPDLIWYPGIDSDDNHRDSFDRCLIATAHFENLAIITKDEKFSLYENRCPIIWYAQASSLA